MELAALRSLQAQAEELRVDMPELASLGAAMERLGVWQVGCGRKVLPDVAQCPACAVSRLDA